jgi:hypothetical protein
MFDLIDEYINPLRSRGYYMYHHVQYSNFYVLPTQIMHVLCMDLLTNNYYFPVHVTLAD